MANIQVLWAKILGVVLTLVGLIGFFMNPVVGIFDVNTLHNVVHLVSGILGLVLGFGMGGKNAPAFNKIFGVVYLLVAIVGFVAGSFLSGLLATNMADHILHLLIGVVTVGIGFFAKTE